MASAETWDGEGAWLSEVGGYIAELMGWPAPEPPVRDRVVIFGSRVVPFQEDLYTRIMSGDRIIWPMPPRHGREFTRERIEELSSGFDSSDLVIVDDPIMGGPTPPPFTLERFDQLLADAHERAGRPDPPVPVHPDLVIRDIGP